MVFEINYIDKHRARKEYTSNYKLELFFFFCCMLCCNAQMDCFVYIFKRLLRGTLREHNLKVGNIVGDIMVTMILLR